MSWQSNRGSKIRKRVCSSSSSSTLPQTYTFKPTILQPTTPRFNHLTLLSKPKPKPDSISNHSHPPITDTNTNTNNKLSASARKLAATLWGMDHLSSSPAINKDYLIDKQVETQFSDPSFTPISDRTHRSSRKKPISSQKLQVSDNVGPLDIVEIETDSRGRTYNGIKESLKDISTSLSTSKELLKVVTRVWGFEDKNRSSIPLVSALRVEIDRARFQVKQLIQEQHSKHSDIQCLIKHFAQEKSEWKKRERERIRSAILCIAQELEVEKKLRRQTENLNKKLGKELSDTKTLLQKAREEVDGEKRAKEILEQVCDELATGGDRSSSAVLKMESDKVIEEIEKEREMLQIADILREERVQMKLKDAQLYFEEKNDVVQKLKNELEIYLSTKTRNVKDYESPRLERIKELDAFLTPCEDTKYEEEESEGSDFHSIELNMDNNNNKSYNWSYQKHEGRKERIQWDSALFASENSNGAKSVESYETSDRERGKEVDEIKRYKSVKSLRDFIISNTKIGTTQNFNSPTRPWSKSLSVQDSGGSVAGDNSPQMQLQLLSGQFGAKPEGRKSTSFKR